MGKFVITKRTNGEFQFNLKANNGLIILNSEGYSSKGNCENGIASTNQNAQIDAIFERKMSSNSKYFFNLKASNGQIIGSSEMYESEAARENGITSVQNNAPEATIEDLSI